MGSFRFGNGGAFSPEKRRQEQAIRDLVAQYSEGETVCHAGGEAKIEDITPHGTVTLNPGKGKPQVKLHVSQIWKLPAKQ